MRLSLNTLAQVYFCTGARNHDLLAFFTDSALTMEFDERMASFKALGHIKATNTPAAICTTSGTAVSECISALLEAQYSDLPLILITGDRPKKMHGTGAPQTINHQDLTKGIAATFIELSLSELSKLELVDPKFPIHINVLVDDTKDHGLETVHHQDLQAFTRFFEKYQKPMFLFSHDQPEMKDLVKRFQLLNIPFYAESLSGARESTWYRSEKEIIELFKTNQFDCVIRIGHTPLSKLWRLLELKPLPVFSFDSRGLPALSYGEVLKMGSKDLVKNEHWWSHFKRLPYNYQDAIATDLLQSLLMKYPLAEISVFKSLEAAIPKDSLVYLGNSLVIRFFELVQTTRFRIHGNRGVNGIDGQLATAIGIANAQEDTVYCILGDITTMYDLSSLFGLPKNFKLIIMNNQGGRIFDMLKLDKRIVLEHDFNFKKIIEALGYSYTRELSQLDNCQVIELMPDRNESEKFMQEWNS